jgi:hypothetical protein
MQIIAHTTIEGKLGNEFYFKNLDTNKYTGCFSDFPEVSAEGETVREAQTNLWNKLSEMIFESLKYK